MENSQVDDVLCGDGFDCEEMVVEQGLSSERSWYGKRKAKLGFDMDKNSGLSTVCLVSRRVYQM